MKFPLSLHLAMTRYLFGNRMRGESRFPLVLMLEPTHRCNLQCSGCGRIREYRDTLSTELSLGECLAAIDECPSPVVTITGGEPLLYGEVGPLAQDAIARGRHVYLCTNGLLLERSIELFHPTSRFTFNVHLDGPRDVHDRIIGQSGVFDRAMAGIRKAKRRGFRVTTNTTIYRETDPQELELLFHLLTQIGVDGILLAPAYHYEAVHEGLFMRREEIVRKFREIEDLSRKYNVISTPLYMDFLRGRRTMNCTPWGNPTRNPRGWKSPCYLITDTHYATYRELMEETDWEHFASGKDPRCRHCMMHCGFEPTVVRELSGSLSDLWRMIVWNLR
jgi:hopanoid biosynthesis associated radical SAM protein HpnH